MLKRLIRSVAALTGHLVMRRDSFSARYIEYPSRGVFDDVLLRVFPRVEELGVIQVGANDGTMADPLFRYMARCRWHGVLIEPMPEAFAKLEQLYAGNARLKLMNKAVDRQRGEREMFHIRAGIPGLPEWAAGLPSLSAARVGTAAAELGLLPDAITSTKVGTVGWDDVWSEFGDRPCDLLVTDVEGHDISLLRLAGLRERRPKVLLFEHACVPEDERWAFYRELTALDYELATSGTDTVAWQR